MNFMFPHIFYYDIEIFQILLFLLKRKTFLTQKYFTKNGIIVRKGFSKSRYYRKKGFLFFSSPIVVDGPWPGKTMVDSGRVRRLFLILPISSS